MRRPQQLGTQRGNNSLAELRARVAAEMATYPEAKANFFTPAIVPGLGTSGGFEMVLEARGDATYSVL